MTNLESTSHTAPHGHNDLLVALAGQPNCGKSTIFSRLTGTHQRVGNYAGVTVEKRSATYRDGDWQIELVDLPGTYNLTSYSPEEGVARHFILLERPELLLAVVDATDLRRHLRFVLQLLEMQTPLVVCLNKGDIMRRRQITIDSRALEILLGVPVVSVVATTGDGFDSLRAAIRTVAVSTNEQHQSTPWRLDYGPQLEPIIERLDASLSQREHLMEDFSSRWLAVKLLEQDRDARRLVQHHTHDESWLGIIEETNDAILAFEQEQGQRPAEVIATMREAWTARLQQHCVKRSRAAVRRSDMIDAVVCRPVLGFFVAAAVLMVVFSLAFAVATRWTWIPCIDGVWRSPVDAVAAIFETWIPAQLDFWLALPAAPFRSLLYDGVLPGVGGVVQFVPIIFFIFLGVAFLEQSGYTARLVVVMDRLLRRFGLHGQSMIPLILGGGIAGGCAVPAVMAARTIRQHRERLLTILIIPLMNCGAKLPVYAVIVAAFFAAYQGIALASLVVISWCVALCVAWSLTRTVVGGRPAPLAVELPAYQLPRLRDCLRTATQQSGWFVQKAGTIILAASVVIWFLVTFPVPTSPMGKVEWRHGTHRLETSYAATIGKSLEPVSRFAGFDWRDNVAFLAGVAAKEVIVSTMAVLDAGDDAGVSHRLQSQKSPAAGVAMLLFVMFYAPCVATLTIIWRETQSLLWTLFAIAYTTLLAFALAVFAFQIGAIVNGV